MDSLQQIERLKELSALSFTEEQTRRMQTELYQMLDFLSALPDVEILPKQQTEQDLPLPVSPNLSPIGDLLGNAPEQYEGFYRIPDRKAVE